MRLRVHVIEHRQRLRRHHRPGPLTQSGAQLIGLGCGLVGLVVELALAGVRPAGLRAIVYGLTPLAPGALAVRKGLGPAGIEEFVALAKARGKDLTVASTGTGTVSHLTGLMFRQRMGLPAWTDVPYQGAAKAVTDLIGGHVDAIFSTVVPLVPHAEEGSLNILAVTTRRRTMALPNVPSIAERTALKDFDVANWLALLAPSGTPRVVIERLAAATDGALKDPEVIGKFRALGLDPAGEGPQPLADTLRASTAQWREVVRQAGLNLN